MSTYQDEVLDALKRCQRALAMMTDPSVIRLTSVGHAFAVAREAETHARAVIAKASPPSPQEGVR